MIDKELYELQSEPEFYGFEFVSDGIKGKIHKVISFSLTPSPDVYNLGFGDKDSVTGEVSDSVVSNNGDTKKILATVAQAVYLFTEKHPDFGVVATGVTPARTRLYRMGIQEHWAQISKEFIVWGFFEDNWETFIPNRNYEAFFVKRKI
jgi:hypothetical protein